MEDYGYNMTYSHLQETNPLIKKLYAANKKADKQIKKMLGRKYKTREQNSVDAVLEYHRAIEELPAYMAAIEKSYQDKVQEKRGEFIKKGDTNLVDSRLAMEYLRSLTGSQRTAALKDQPELRALADRHRNVFGTPESDVAIFEDMDQVFFEVYREDLQVVKESYDALRDLEVSFKLTLQQPFESLQEAELLLSNFMESEVPEKDVAGEEPEEKEEVA